MPCTCCFLTISISTFATQGVGDAAATFDANNILEMQNVMEDYLFSNYKLKKLVELGKKQSMKFSWEKCVNETIDVYRKLLN